jgi:lysophospholipase
MMQPKTNTKYDTVDGDLIFDNAAVGHQLNADRHDMLAPGKATTEKK